MTPLGTRITLVFGFILVGFLGAFLVELLLSVGSDREFGHTQRGHVVGWLGLAVMSLVFVYSLKKRHGLNVGTPRGWLHVHIVAGVVGPVLILVHAGSHFHALVPLVTMVIMAIIVISGVVGQAVHLLALKTLNQQRRQLVQEDTPQEEIDGRLEELAWEEELFRWWRAIHAPLTITFVVMAALHILGALYFGGL